MFKIGDKVLTKKRSDIKEYIDSPRFVDGMISQCDKFAEITHIEKDNDSCMVYLNVAGSPTSFWWDVRWVIDAKPFSTKWREI